MNHGNILIRKSANQCISPNHAISLSSKRNGTGFINFSRKSAERLYKNKIESQSAFKSENEPKQQFLEKGKNMKRLKLKKYNISTAEFWDKKNKEREILVKHMLKYLTFNLKRKKNKQKLGHRLATSISNLQSQYFTAQSIYHQKGKFQEQSNEIDEAPLSNVKQNKNSQFMGQRILSKNLLIFQRKLYPNQMEKPQNLSVEVRKIKHFGEYLDESTLNPWQNQPLECKQIEIRRESLNFSNE